MKKLLFNLLLVATGALSVTACTGSYAVVGPPSYYPTETVVIAPSPRHVWIPGRYQYRNNNYVRAPGYHQLPPRGRTSYVEGRWNQSSRGYRYQRGHWR